MQRKRFIYYTIAGAAVALAGPFTSCRHPAVSPLAQPDFLSHLVDATTLREIGAAYLAQTPSEARENKLIELLNTRVAPQNIQNDFVSGKTIILKGWVLSLTEARQCALYALDSQ